MRTRKDLTLSLLDYQSGRLRMSGQHEKVVVLRRSGEVELVDTVELGFPLGLDDDISDFVAELTLELAPGDGVILYTDGITEAQNEAGEFYGLQRLSRVASLHWAEPAAAVKRAILDDVYQYIGAHRIYDDITLLVIKQK